MYSSTQPNGQVLLNLYNGTVSIFRKNNQYRCYISVGSNHAKIFKYFPHGIMFRWSTNSSNIDIITPNKHDYEMALKIVVIY